MSQRLALLALSIAACVAEETAPLVPACAAPQVALPDGRCIRPGVPPDGCAAGFVHDGAYGCEPLLPPEPCPPGSMAVPGETACRAVAPCGAGKWGDIPVDAATEHVDGAYRGADSDGSAERPWTSFSDAVLAAAPGAIVALAEGSYLGDTRVQGKPLRIWGVCPEKVELSGTGADAAALIVLDGAGGSEVHTLSITGPQSGLIFSGAENVILDRVWVHDTGRDGMHLEPTLGFTSVTLSGTLVEQSYELGVFAYGSQLIVERSVIRSTAPSSAGEYGRGIEVTACLPADGCPEVVRSSLLLEGSVVEQNHEYGVFVTGSDATIEATVVRENMGYGVDFGPVCNGNSCDPTPRASGLVKSSVIERNHGAGLFIAAADVTVEKTSCRRTQPRVSDSSQGRGITIQPACAAGVCNSMTGSTAVVRASLIDESTEFGLSVIGSAATVDATVVRRTAARPDGFLGRGISFQISCSATRCDPTAPSNGIVRGSLVEDSVDYGIIFFSSSGSVDDTVVRRTAPRVADGLFGDGVAVTGEHLAVEASFANVLVQDSARAGLANFGAAVALTRTALVCADISLDGEPFEGRDFAFEDRGGNLCGCPMADGACSAVSVGLTAPEAVAPTE